MREKRILVIDDDEGVRAIVQISLEVAGGYSVLTAASGKEGLTLAIAEQPDAIILDVMMPEMDGEATFAQLQSHATTKNIPTILLTAKAQNSEQQRFTDLGVTGLITKPFEAMDLVEQIRQILNW